MRIDIDAKQLKALLDAGEAVVIDTRQPAQYVAESIEGAINIKGVTALQLEDFRHKKVVFQCNSGGGSARACAIVQDDLGYDIYNLAGGISAWKNAGYPVK